MNSQGPIIRRAIHRVSDPRTATIIVIGVSVLLAFQFYFLRELLAAESLLALIFIPMLSIVGAIYTIGLASERGLHAVAVRVHSKPVSRRRGFETPSTELPH